MQPLTESLDAILIALERLQRPAVGLLRPGIERKDVERIMSAANVPLPVAARELYRWRDGTDIQKDCVLDDAHFIPGFYLLSLNDAVTTYLALRSDSRWRQSWFPLLANGGGDFFAISCSEDMKLRGQIIGFIVGIEEQPVEYESLASMMATFAECFRIGVCFVSPEGALEMDDLAHAMLARRFNPSTEVWRVN